MRQVKFLVFFSSVRSFIFRLKEDIGGLERNLDSKDDKITRLKEEKEYLELTRNEQGNTIDETATLIRELRDKLLESQSDVNKLKRRLEGTF